MSDPAGHNPIRDLENFDTQGLAVNPLAPEEVRRRGDRLRRRRNAAGVVAGVAAVALIATPIALIAGGDSGSPSPAPPGPTVTETPPASGVTEIPDEFPLAAGFPTESEEEDPISGPRRQLDDLDFQACGEPVPDAPREDRMVATFTNAEDYRLRALSTYVDGAAAEAALRSMTDRWEACPEDPVRSDGYVTLRELRPVPVGDEAWAVLERDTFQGAESPFGGTIMVVRVGNAILAESRGGHAGYPSGNGERMLDGLVDSAFPVIDKMCLFAAEGCAEGEGEGDEPTALSPADLITPEETQPRYESAWETVETYDGEGAEPASPCFGNTFEGRNATSVFRRDFEMHGPQGPLDGNRMTAVVAEFPDKQTAQAAYIGFGEDAGLCQDAIVTEIAEKYTSLAGGEVPLENVHGLARTWFATYGPYLGAADAVYRLETGVAWVGKRVVVMTTMVGPFEPGKPPSPTAMEAMLVQAAERLAPGPEGSITPVTPMV